MNRIFAFLVLFVLVLGGCSTVAVKNRVDKFGTASRIYENALLESKFSVAYRLTEPTEKTRVADFDTFKKYRVINYHVLKLHVAPSGLEVYQKVKIEFIMLNSMILKTFFDNQYWKYNEEKKGWFLHTGLPNFTAKKSPKN